MWVYITLNMQSSRIEKEASKNDETNQTDQAWNVEDCDVAVFLVVERDFILFSKSSCLPMPLVVGA